MLLLWPLSIDCRLVSVGFELEPEGVTPAGLEGAPTPPVPIGIPGAGDEEGWPGVEEGGPGVGGACGVVTIGDLVTCVVVTTEEVLTSTWEYGGREMLYGAGHAIVGACAEGWMPLESVGSESIEVWIGVSGGA
jgi:hypothetical protein